MPKKSILQNKEIMQKVASKHLSIRDCLKELGLRAAGGNYAAFKLACLKHNIKIPSGEIHPNRKNKSKISLKELLVDNCNYYKSSRLKERLIKGGYLENRCNICDIEPIWNSRQLTLQLDHINGKHSDNRIENLRILCPNCHSQTDTFAGKNRMVDRLGF